MFSGMLRAAAISSVSLCLLGAAQAQEIPVEIPPTSEVPGPPPGFLDPPPVVTPEPLVAPQPAPAPIPLTAPLPSQPQRRWGLGFAVGAGFAGLSPTNSASDMRKSPSFAFLLPSFEARFFTKSGGSFDLTVPVLNMAVIYALTGVFTFNLDAFYSVNAGTSGTRFIGGPGLGLSAAGGDLGATVGLRIPAQLGVEMLNRSRSFGFAVLTRPWLEFDFASSGPSRYGGFGGGMMFDLAFRFYKTR